MPVASLGQLHTEFTGHLSHGRRPEAFATAKQVVGHILKVQDAVLAHQFLNQLWDSARSLSEWQATLRLHAHVDVARAAALPLPSASAMSRGKANYVLTESARYYLSAAQSMFLVGDFATGQKLLGAAATVFEWMADRQYRVDPLQNSPRQIILDHRAARALPFVPADLSTLFYIAGLQWNDANRVFMEHFGKASDHAHRYQSGGDMADRLGHVWAWDHTQFWEGLRTVHRQIMDGVRQTKPQSSEVWKVMQWESGLLQALQPYSQRNPKQPMRMEVRYQETYTRSMVLNVMSDIWTTMMQGARLLHSQAAPSPALVLPLSPWQLNVSPAAEVMQIEALAWRLGVHTQIVEQMLVNGEINWASQEDVLRQYMQECGLTDPALATARLNEWRNQLAYVQFRRYAREHSTEMGFANQRRINLGM